MLSSCWWWVSWVTFGKNGLSRTKVKGFIPKRKNFRSENHKKFEKKKEKRQKKRQKSDRLSLFKLIFVVFIGTQKKRQKCDKSDKMSLFQFVGGHPRHKGVSWKYLTRKDWILTLKISFALFTLYLIIQFIAVEITVRSFLWIKITHREDNRPFPTSREDATWQVALAALEFCTFCCRFCG